jgi:hypothetical protein
MTERFNPPPGWPLPSGWSPPAGWEPDPSWPPAPAGWRFWLADVAEQSVAQYPSVAANPTKSFGPWSDSAVGKRLVILGTVGVVVLVALAGAVVMFLHSRGNSAAHNGGNSAAPNGSTLSTEVPDEAWKTIPSAAPPVLPAGAVECGTSPSGAYRGAARGNDVTSCPFAESVRDALNSAGGQVPATVDAFSPVTKKHYRMSCAMEQVITCRGGNDAVVYVYEHAAVTAAPLAKAFPSDEQILQAPK